MPSSFTLQELKNDWNHLSPYFNSNELEVLASRGGYHMPHSVFVILTRVLEYEQIANLIMNGIQDAADLSQMNYKEFMSLVQCDWKAAVAVTIAFGRTA